uniref:Uncharacterized protein n=1 Tax=Timema cristinae TaxID=61476 RepID=A0A7R9HCS7_TIMCR|nr:unnamed protein product [Timema cristinae]
MVYLITIAEPVKVTWWSSSKVSDFCAGRPGKNNTRSNTSLRKLVSMLDCARALATVTTLGQWWRIGPSAVYLPLHPLLKRPTSRPRQLARTLVDITRVKVNGFSTETLSVTSSGVGSFTEREV